MEDLHYYLEFGVSAVGLIGGFVAYILRLGVKHDILENNEMIDRQFTELRDKQYATINSLRDELIRELGSAITKQAEKIDRNERSIADLLSLHYVRVDVHQQTISGIQERFAAVRELIEVNMERIEQRLDRQLSDLKELIMHDGK